MIVIAGAGPAGLGVAHALRDVPHTIVEREAEAGGLCRSFEVGGCIFDYGGHAFFTRYPEVERLLEELAPEPVHRQPRNAWVWSHGTFVPYPFQSNLHGLPVEVVRECLLGAVRRYADRESPPPTNLLEFAHAQFGTGIAEHFLVPYNSKLWAHPLDTIAVSWTGDRIVQPDIDDIIAGALSRRDFRDYPNATVRYPARGGFVELFRPLMEKSAAVQVRDTVTRVNLTTRTAWTAGGNRLDFRHLVSTIPLPELVECTDEAGERERQAAAALRYNSLYLVSLAVDKRNATEMHRVYAADPAIPFHKLVLNNTSSPALWSSPAFGVQAEISFSPYKAVDRGRVLDETVSALVGMGLLRGPEDVWQSDIREIRYAYPVATTEGQQAVALLRDFYAAHDVSILGRFGEWAYINSDGALHRGLRLGETLRNAVR